LPARQHGHETGIEQHRIAARARYATQDSLEMLRILGSGAALDVGEGSPRQTGILGGEDETANLTPVQSRDHRLAGDRDLVGAVAAVNHERFLRAQFGQHPANRLDQVFRKDPQQLPADPGRVGQRAEKIEYRPHAQLPAHRRCVLHRRVMTRGEQEADTHLVDHFGHLVRRQVDGHTQVFEHVGTAAGR